MSFFKLIIESYKDLWDRSRVEFILTTASMALSVSAFVIIILK